MRVAGRIVAWRPHGKTVFAHLADDQWSRIQLYFRRDDLGDDAFARLELLDIGDVIGVAGPLFRTRTGETTVRVYGGDTAGQIAPPAAIRQGGGGGRAPSFATRASPIPSSAIVSDTPTSPSMPRCGRASSRDRG